MAIPIVDMKDLGLGNSGKPSNENLKQVSKELDAAFSSVGFVYLKNHGLSQNVVDGVLKASSDFFQLPDSVKNAFRRSVHHIDGYTGKDQEILESKSTHEIREAYDVTSMDVGFDNKEHPEFFNSIHRILPELSELSRRLLRCLAIALGTTEIIRMFKFQSSFQFYTENGIQLT